MKRAELEAGTRYAVLSPSQRGRVSDRYGPNAKEVEVIDTRPLFKPVYRGWSTRDEGEVTVTTSTFGRVKARDYTSKVEADGYGAKDAKRYVKVVRRQTLGWKDDVYFTIEAIPISQVAMLWEDFERERGAADRRRKAEDREYERELEAKRIASVDRAKRRERLELALGDHSLFGARIFEGEVVITGAFADLLDLAKVARNL